jgi:hypothetical protein
MSRMAMTEPLKRRELFPGNGRPDPTLPVRELSEQADHASVPDRSAGGAHYLFANVIGYHKRPIWEPLLRSSAAKVSCRLR